MAFKLNGFTYFFSNCKYTIYFQNNNFFVSNTHLPKPLFRLYFFVPQGTSANHQSILLILT